MEQLRRGRRVIMGKMKMARMAAMLLALGAVASADVSSRGQAFHPKRLGLVKTLVPRLGALYGCAFSPDGRRIAVAGVEGRVRIFSTGTWKEERALPKVEGGAWCVAWSADGKRLATGGLDGSLRIFDTAEWQERRLAGHASYVYGVSFSPDGKALLTGSADNTARVWDAATGTELRTLGGHTAYVYGVAFSPDGRVAATSSYDATIKLWDAATWAELKTLRGHANSALGLAFSPNGRWLASGSSDFTVRIWDVQTGAELRSLGAQGGQIFSLAFTQDGEHLVTAAARTVKVWQTKTWTEAAVLEHHSSDVYGVSISRGGRYIATASLDMQLKVWGNVPGGTTKLKPKGFFGVTVQTGENGEGCVVTQVLAGTAAEAAGMQAGDVILSVNGTKVADHQEAIAAIGSHSEGDEVVFRVLRGGGTIDVKAKLGRRMEGQ